VRLGAANVANASARALLPIAQCGAWRRTFTLKENSMRQTVVGVFERYATARQAAQQLRESGFGDSVYVTDEVASIEGEAPDAGHESRDDGGFLAQVRGFFADIFDGDDKEVSPYAEALRGGGGVVKVEVEAESQAEAARAALEAAGAMDFDERSREWRASGWQEQGGSIRQSQSTNVGQGALSDAGDEAGRDMARVATGAEQGGASSGSSQGLMDRKGGVRIYPRPVQSEVEDTIDMAQPESARADPGVVAASDQSHFEANYAPSGGLWQDYEPAYRYGDALQSDTRYMGRGWDEVEPDLRSGWESRNAGPWEKFKGAIRHGWERMTT
jgi:hypothetical protein